ncbi:MAG: septum formation initiator family protein [Verrucomicrobia bacterium]|nr:septum formation initiator family protein [Verrucomicrobiota bacterium]
MNVDLGIWAKLSRLILVLLLLATVAAVAVWYFPLIEKNEGFRKQKLRLEEEIKKAEDDQKRLKASLYSLEHDPRTLERMAREKLGYARSNETVVRFETAPAPATNSATARR